MAFVCCLCSGAFRKQARRASAAFQDPFAIRPGSWSGRQTPDAVPAYSTTPPLGPLSPEVVDAISQTSVELRQSFAISILSSSSCTSPRYGLGTTTLEARGGTPQASSISVSEDPVPPLLLSESLQSSTNTGTEQGRHQLSHYQHDPRHPLTLPAGEQQAPPSYDPSWMAAVLEESQDHSQRRSRRANNNQLFAPLSRIAQESRFGLGSQRASSSRVQQLFTMGSHRRTESLHAPQERMPIQHSLFHPRRLGARGEGSTSRRSQTWTGEPIVLPLNHHPSPVSGTSQDEIFTSTSSVSTSHARLLPSEPSTSLLPDLIVADETTDPGRQAGHDSHTLIPSP